MKTSEKNDTLMYAPSMDAFVNRWFRTYDEARTSLESEGGYLFPYKNQFFITGKEAIRELGMDPDDPDWELIGRDWVRPLNPEAWERLKKERMRKV
jgi:hypothetical protein